MTTSSPIEWTEQAVPYICWDRNWTVGDIKQRLTDAQGSSRHQLMAWLMRELKTSEVWYFLKPTEIYQEFDHIKRWLGPAESRWTFLLKTWHELGKV
ncbi:MAG TPA: hypothetical protein PKE55_11095 [Kiritimatiellia bacterium]|nr:hypothetical protein [Kiritimatiellia bacterium]